MKAPGAKLPNSVMPDWAARHVRVPELDGIRAIAIWMVLILHIFYVWTPTNYHFPVIPGFVMLAVGHGWLWTFGCCSALHPGRASLCGVSPHGVRAPGLALYRIPSQPSSANQRQP